MRAYALESAIYLVATPIGNLQDFSARAEQVLRDVDLVAAEDTRHTKRLFDQFSISTPMVSLHEHNEKQKTEELITRIREQKISLAVVSDAGTPLISDPGYVLVAQARELGVRVVPVPGPCALVAALSASGLPSSQFVFEGFLPSKSGARRAKLEGLSSETRTAIYYESPHRILATVDQLAELFPLRRVCLARELTKRFETIHTAIAKDMLAWLSADAMQQKGEFVLLIEGARPSEDKEELLSIDVKALLARLLIELPPKQAAAVVADFSSWTKKELYQMAVNLK